MVLLNVDDKQLSILIDSLDCLITHYHEYSYDLPDVIAMATTAVEFMEARKGAVNASHGSINDKENSSDYDPNMDPDAKMPGHHWVMGKGWIKN